LDQSLERVQSGLEPLSSQGAKGLIHSTNSSCTERAEDLH
jgi:hypothetical protein